MENVKVANEQELEAFVKGAMDTLGAKGVSESDARQLLQSALDKHAAELGLVPQEQPNRQVVDEFKKKACEFLRPKK